MTTPLIETHALAEKLKDPAIVVLDSSWHLPATGRDGKAEYQKEHIAGARFFDIDATGDQGSHLPHMLPSADEFEKLMGEMGISNNSRVIIYDSVGVTSAARCWWTLRVFGHKDVSVLNGGLPKWKSEDRPVTDEIQHVKTRIYSATLNTAMVADRQDLEHNMTTKKYKVLDARSHGRFTGEEPEPRPGVAGGHIPDSVSLPFMELLDGTVMKSAGEIRNVLAEKGITDSSTIITSCGSGVTASVITLALELAGFGMHKLYDGSWSEWGTLPDTPKHTT